MSITKDEENYWDDIEKNFFCFESNEVKNILHILTNLFL